MRSLVVVIALVLALLVGLWKLLAVPALQAAPADGRAPAAGTSEPPAPARPLAGLAAPAADGAAAAAVPDGEAREAVGAGVRGRLVYPADLDPEQKRALPPFVVRLVDRERQLAETATSSPAGAFGAEFAFHARPHAPQSVVVEPPNGWVVKPARRYAPHRAQEVWEVELEVLPVERVVERYRLEGPDVPWVACSVEVRDAFGNHVADARVSMTLLAAAPQHVVTSGLAACRAVPHGPSAGAGAFSVSTPLAQREDWGKVLLNVEDVPRTDLVERAVESMDVYSAYNLARGTWRLRVEAPGFLPEERVLDLRENASLELVLKLAQPAGDVVATLTSASGAYDEGVSVVLRRVRLGGELRRTVTWSGERGVRIGTARFEALPAGDYILRLHRVDDTPWTPEHVLVRPPAETLFHAQDTGVGRFAFRVLDAVTHAPLETCDVELSLGGRRVKRFNLPCGEPVLERYPLEGRLDWVVRAPGFLEARGGRDAFRPAQPGAAGAGHVAEVVLGRDPLAAWDGR